jgi:histidinol-phosphate/aromatic aminotransferase/cobyric acid decarboxylase-like protein
MMSSTGIIERVAGLQAPWSVNGFAQEFFVAALNEANYFVDMWATTPRYRAEMVALFKELGVRPKEDSPGWVPFVCVDMLSEEIAKRALQVAHDAGFPVRSCESFGLPRFIRCAVRPPDLSRQLVAALAGDRELVDLIRSIR